MQLSLDDDSGILALVNCATYSSFVDEDWTYEQIIEHFRSQAQSESILVWDAGDGGNHYRIEVRHGISEEAGFRSTRGCLQVTAAKVYLASYTALTMAAQFEDETLPGKGETDLSIPLENGQYIIRVVQMYDPDELDSLSKGLPHFVIEIEPGRTDTSGNPGWLPD